MPYTRDTPDATDTPDAAAQGLTTVTPLRDLVAARFDRRWSAFAADHPNLAATIDRTRLIHTTTHLLRQDPRYRQAMREADLDEDRLARAAEALDRLEQVIHLMLPR